jgi:tRNA pseudouridine55 synthase
LPVEDVQPSTEAPAQSTTAKIDKPSAETMARPPAARLRMTVSSGFYVRSLCHDLGLAVQSHGLMSSLIRSRQGDYELGNNVLEYSDFEAGLETWQPKLQVELEKFMDKEGWEPETVDEDDQTWQAHNKEHIAERKEKDRDRSYKGGRREGGRWRGGGKKNYYSKNMRGGQD